MATLYYRPFSSKVSSTDIYRCNLNRTHRDVCLIIRRVIWFDLIHLGMHTRGWYSYPTFKIKCNSVKAKCSGIGLKQTQPNINSTAYTISHEICTRFWCVLLCCGYSPVLSSESWDLLTHIIRDYLADNGEIALYQWRNRERYGQELLLSNRNRTQQPKRCVQDASCAPFY